MQTEMLCKRKRKRNENTRVYVYRYKECGVLKCTIIPIIIGATGVVTRSLRRKLETVPGKHSIDSLQNTAMLGTSHIIRKVKLEA